MRIESLEIQEFADGEHTGLTRRDIDGNSLLLLGGSRTGKTLSFNAILYALLGSKETIDLSTGRRNRVDISLSNGADFSRGQPRAEYENNGEYFESTEAIDRLNDDLGNLEIIKHHFLHSHVDNLPLNNLSKDERLKVIRWVTNKELEERIERFEEAKERLEGLVQNTEDEHRRLSEKREETDRQISELESQLEKFQNLEEKIETGELEDIRDRLLENEELNERLSELFDRQEDLRQRLRKKYRLKRKQENLSEEVRQVIAEAVNDFVCPTCGRHVSTEKAQNRMGQGHCPFCGQDHSLRELKNDIRGRIENSDEILEQLSSEIRELSEEKEEVEDEIEEIQTELPELSGLDAFTERILENNDYDISQVRSEAEEELEKTETRLEELEQEKGEIDSRVDEDSTKLEVYRDSLEHASDRLEELSQESYETGVAEFTSVWEDLYQEMSPAIGLEINVNEEGEIQLPGRNSLREYDASGDLSSSEYVLLNFSFALALNKFATENGFTSWDVFVMDEPFDNLDPESRSEVLSFVKESDHQFIVTSSDTGLEDEFDLVENLEREQIQTELSRYLE
ncbi:MAG: hypothetical protein ABEI86_02970 [Halobacteriaceae archaeon]